MKDGDVLLLENTRFHKGEEKNDPAFVAALAKLGDIYVNDAFSAAHRAHASTEGLGHKLPAYAGRAMQAELEALDARRWPTRSGRSSRSSAAPRCRPSSTCSATSSSKVDALVIGGGMANTFLLAQGIGVGKSLCEHDLADTARAIIDKAEEAQLRDRAAGRRRGRQRSSRRTRRSHASTVDAIPADEMILDIGPQSIARIEARDRRCRRRWSGTARSAPSR